LNKAKKGDKREPLICKSKQQSFHSIKEALLNALALGLPNVRKSFFLYVQERNGMASA
jgi:hypothetical protein